MYYNSQIKINPNLNHILSEHLIDIQKQKNNVLTIHQVESTQNNNQVPLPNYSRPAQNWNENQNWNTMPNQNMSGNVPSQNWANVPNNMGNTPNNMNNTPNQNMGNMPSQNWANVPNNMGNMPNTNAGSPNFNSSNRTCISNRELENMRSLYTTINQALNPYVNRVLDEFEYMGSPIYSYGGIDRELLAQLIDRAMLMSRQELDNIDEIFLDQNPNISILNEWDRFRLLRSTLESLILSEIFTNRRPNYFNTYAPNIF